MYLLLILYSLFFLLIIYLFTLIGLFCMVPLNGMCLFSAFSVKLDVEATLKTNIYIYTYKKKKKKMCFQTVEGEALEGRVSTTLIRDVESELLPEDHPDTPLHLNIQQCVMLTEKQLTQICPVLSAMCVTHSACEKAACLLYFRFWFINFSVPI